MDRSPWRVGSLAIARIVMAVIIVAGFSRCEDNGLTPAEKEVATFSQQLQGDWVLDKVTAQTRAGGVVTISPVRDYSCDRLSAVFESRDVVSRYSFSYSDRVLHVQKKYTCRLAPEQLAWQIELSDEPAQHLNWMTGKSFLIREVNEGVVSAEFTLAFFNLTNRSPEGQPATSATRNKLFLDVVYDIREGTSFRLEFAKSE